MTQREDKAALREAAAAVEEQIAAEVQAVMDAEDVAHKLVEQAAHDAAALSIVEGDAPDIAVKHFWAQLLREVTRADPNTP